ncbi:hypothetical protein TNCV_295141 [Trichonephila clavipes]|nr:hypothetical protein TNCV_295141 [Trichonephila clavipes]
MGFSQVVDAAKHITVLLAGPAIVLDQFISEDFESRRHVPCRSSYHTWGKPFSAVKVDFPPTFESRPTT